MNLCHVLILFWTLQRSPPSISALHQPLAFSLTLSQKHSQEICPSLTIQCFPLLCLALENTDLLSHSPRSTSVLSDHSNIFITFPHALLSYPTYCSIHMHPSISTQCSICISYILSKHFQYIYCTDL